MHNRRDITPGSFLQRRNDVANRLEGENPSTATLDEARRWAARYDQLVALKSELLELCQRNADHSEPEVARAIRDTDMILLEVELSRFQQKRDYWRIRATELAGNGRRGGND